MIGAAALLCPGWLHIFCAGNLQALKGVNKGVRANLPPLSCAGRCTAVGIGRGFLRRLHLHMFALAG